MTNNTRKVNKLLNLFWGAVLLAPIVAWTLVGAVALFQGEVSSITPLSAFIESFIGVIPAVDWLDMIWTKLFAVDGVLPFTTLSMVSLPIVNYLILWSVLRMLVSVFLWLPCFASKIIERWFE